jgi:hypothetical protein
LVAKKDFNAPKHEDLDVPNLEVIKAMQSLTSKGLVKTQFSWQWYYYVLTPEGVEYLREWCVVLSLTWGTNRNIAIQAPSPHRDCPRHTQEGGSSSPSCRCPPGWRGCLPRPTSRPRRVQEEGGRCSQRVPATVRWCRPRCSSGVDSYVIVAICRIPHALGAAWGCRSSMVVRTTSMSLCWWMSFYLAFHCRLSQKL